ncbi:MULTISPECIES: neuraminidase-like domain-containing protein [Photorhabdus]|uniref:Tc toxin subunit A-related protein n=1 Tax=Photorhabdus TaxID=29487 RepID=UPI0007B4C88D|nr:MULTISPECIES: neuraminidase-like domain-containing protein [Photorhabdus]AWK40892.1 toxin [Photorhabdus laumondii subsp. laumondii]AXG41700.1 toxin [Photorhabdus laumondii subsp. laumondii]MCC8389185.1 toxin [Photorhabdus laumondii]MCZ1248830.1 toxin [Photorhabdus laumondii subsp. laumondii]NDL15669.1 toxin [Photorhabdus laumondii subsp. laumondii]
MSTVTPERPEMTQQEQKANQLHEASILKRANPQLQNAVHLALTTPHADQQGYNSKFGGRASQYVAPDAVASMFSPAAYLTELYRQARDLHAESSIYHLDKRRPDLKSLILSQQNMDDEVSTLSLSNKVLLEGIQTQAGQQGHTHVMKALSTFHSSGSLPYHDAYENVRKVIQLQAPVFEQFNTSPETTIAKLKYQTSLLGINISISPELFNILTDKITDDEEEIKRLYKKNFDDIQPSLMATLEYLKIYYNLTDEEINQSINQRNIERIHNEMNSKYGSQQPAQYYLLKLNKIILVSRATDMAPEILKKIASSRTYHAISQPMEVILEYNPTIYDELNDIPDINTEILKKIFRVKYYMQRYNIDAETALILCNAPISEDYYSPSPNQFNRLFNTPPLNSRDFYASDEEIDLSQNSADSRQKEVLKRAFNVDDISLYQLLKMTHRDNGNGKIINNLTNISYLYLTKLLADVHQLTVNELNLLLIAIGEGSTSLSGISDDNLSVLIDKLYNVTQWLHAQKWNKCLLFMMTTTDYNKTLTPEIQNLLDAVYNGLQDLNSENEANLLLKISPYIAAALQLPSENSAYYMLTWADQLKPGSGAMTAKKFWKWLQSQHTPEQSTTETEEQAVQYCQCLAQLALIYHSIGLSESTLRLFVTKPQHFGLTAGATSTHNALSLIKLTRFADWVNSLGEKASSVLTEFEKGTLETKQLADAMSLDKNLLEQASTHVQVNFSNWASLDTIQQWVNIARQLNISPQDVSTLAQVLDIEPSTDYSQWEKIAAILTAGLDTQQANTLHTFLDESRSTALSEYYIHKVANAEAKIKNRDDLYQYLLIDNQVSAAIKTTPIAEAIASIQLYISRALKNMEGNAVSQVANRPFFTDWDKYNKRYSTWASIAKLIYYPENYIDPTICIGRTKMMDTLLQSISQSQLNTDTVEDAFMSYLTSFEQVANLEIVSAYHDDINSNQGLTYFIGHNKTEVNQYYWRSVDHNKFNDGKFPANAWSEWYKIDCPINPYKDTIRPVIFQSRLYLIWLEQKKIAKQTDNNQTIECYYYELKLAHIRYDWTWNTPITLEVHDKISAVLKTSDLLDQLQEYQKQLEDKLKEQQEEVERLKPIAPLNPVSPPQPIAPLKSLQLLPPLIEQRKKQLAQWERELNEQGQSTTEISVREKQLELNQQDIQKELDRLESELIRKQPGFYCANHQDNKLLVIFYQKQDALDKYTTDAPIKGLYISSNILPEDINLGDYIPNIRNQFDTDIGVNGIIKVNNRYEVSSSIEISDHNILTLYHDTNGAQYMQWGAYRIRLNTLFARKLVSRAMSGIDTILSMETQKLSEPQLKAGFFANFTLPKYDQNIHGNERWFKIHIGNINGDNSMRLYYQGTLTDNETSITLFVPYKKDLYTMEGVRIGVQYKQKFYQDWWEPAFFYFNETQQKFVLINDTAHDSAMTHGGERSPVKKYQGFSNVSVLSEHTEPMDFNGANSLYFWELFYYAPMLIAQRLLHEQNFDEANRWLKYVWNPSGYIEHGQIQHYRWNVRPLLEDTRWNDDPLNSVDPDAIAQYDPMHYKVVTFMRTLDLLLDRGDYAYRQLERDTLNEAKMWYMQALHLLGDKPHLSFSSEWCKPSLGDAARTEKQEEHAQAMTALRQGDISRHSNPTDLFLPQVNEVMQNYWQKLEQRLYNLRNNLSIDGQPLHLSIYATPADPKALLSATVASAQGGNKLPTPFMSLWRFPQMLENARGMVSQLTQFGSTLQNIIERQDAEALNTLLQNQAAELILTNLSIQDKTIEELDAEKIVLEKSKAGAQSRFDSYKKLYDENINAGENRVMALHASIAGLSTALQASRLAGAALDLAPNIFGFADGGSRWGAIAEATGNVMEFSASVMNTEADKISQSEAYRRRHQEWEIQRNNAEAEIKQIDAQLQSLAIRREAAVLQKTSLKTQQEQTQAQLTFLQRKFSNQTLYHWLRGRLAAIYFQFYDLAVARCLMAEMAYRWETNDTAANFIKPGAWQGTHAGLLAGETLMLNLAQMEDAYLRWDQRALEVERTISLTQFYGALPEKSFNLATRISALLAGGTTDPVDHPPVTLENDQLSAKISLSDLSLHSDYPEGNGVGNIRRIKQISVTLPALLGPYQDVQAILSYGGSETGLAESCKSLAISHGINDSGQFQLDFNNGKLLPFEGIAINDTGTLTLNFPNATSKQQAMLQALSDIILHIRYTIRQ